jgi:HNH endonuclease
MKNLPSVSYLHECFDYDPVTGDLRWKQRPETHFIHQGGRGSRMWQSRFPGTIAGSVDSHGARQVEINAETHLVHRVIWKWMTGEDPPSTIDHRDRNPSNNRWANLRSASYIQQGWNKEARKDSLSGRRGVQLRNGRWGVRVRIDGKVKRLGSFATLEEAAAVHDAAVKPIMGDFSPHG